MRQCLCIFSYMSVWTVASETVINTAVRRQILKNSDASIHWEELTWHTFYGLSYTFICLSNLATSVFYQEINLLYTPTTFCIVQNCEMDFNNIASCSSACLETFGEIRWRYWSMLCNRENQSYSFVSLSLTSVFHGGFFFPMAALVPISWPVTTAAQVVQYTNHCEPYMGVVRLLFE